VTGSADDAAARRRRAVFGDVLPKSSHQAFLPAEDSLELPVEPSERFIVLRAQRFN